MKEMILIALASCCSLPLCNAGDLNPEEVKGLLHGWESRLTSMEIGLRGKINVHLQQGYARSTKEKITGNEILILPFEYFQSGDGQAYHKFTGEKSFDRSSGRREFQGHETWITGEGILALWESVNVYEILKVTRASNPLDIILRAPAPMPVSLLELGFGPGSTPYHELVADYVDVADIDASVEGKDVSVSWSTDWGKVVPAWDGYEYKEAILLGLDLGGALKKRVSHELVKNSRNGSLPADAVSTATVITECSDFQQYNNVSIPMKVKHVIRNIPLSQKEVPKNPVELEPWIVIELVIDEIVKEVPSDKFFPEIPVGARIYDTIAQEGFFYGEPPEDMLKALRD